MTLLKNKVKQYRITQLHINKILRQIYIILQTIMKQGSQNKKNKEII